MTKEMTCIVCPNGCLMRIEQEGDKIEVFDAICKRGIEFAKNELTNPTRSITTTVATKFEDYPLLSVKTSGELPKDKIFEAMKKINSTIVKKRVKVDDVVIKNLFGTDVVATSDMTLDVKTQRLID
jgi:CxxC motif-containing protein